jgi:tRNA threonylcarbamoyladenosine biosynthesis protein TsaB
MATLLHIETSVKSCSVALSHEGKLVNCVEEHAENYVHAEKLHVFIEQVFNQTLFTLTDIKGVHISAGPGSFTGLRIGVSAAKGICYALGIPLLKMSSLEVLYNTLRLSHPAINGDYYIPMIDARRMEVYGCVFDSGKNKLVHESAIIIDESSFMELQGNVILFGDGADKLTHMNFNHNHILVIPDIKPSARFMIDSGFEHYLKQEFEDLAYFSPNYLKAFNSTGK